MGSGPRGELMEEQRPKIAMARKDGAAGTGSQTLMRGLDVIEAVSERAMNLIELAERLRLARSTVHRLASALVERSYLTFTPRAGYRLGPRLLELGGRAGAQSDVVQVARPHLDGLAAASADAVHPAVTDGAQVLHVDEAPGPLSRGGLSP